MQTMKFYMDTHDKNNGTFPEGITKEQLSEFYKNYEKACKEENVISVKIHAGIEGGKAFCLNMAYDEAAVFRVHEKVGLPYDSIVEVQTISPSDLLHN